MYLVSRLLLCLRSPRAFLSFPTRRSSDLVVLHVDRFVAAGVRREARLHGPRAAVGVVLAPRDRREPDRTPEGRRVTRRAHEVVEVLPPRLDRKSTRLNSSHRCTSYPVFCCVCGLPALFSLSLRDALPI